MEYRRRYRRNSSNHERQTGGAARAFVLLVIFGVTAYLIIGTGIGKKIKDGYALSLLNSCAGKAANAEKAEIIETEQPLETEEALLPKETEPTRGDTVEVSLPGLEMFMIQIGIYDSPEECSAYCEELKNIGAAGYVYNDSGSYRLIAAAYTGEDEAEKMQGLLTGDGYESTIFHKRISGVSLLITAEDELLLPIKNSLLYAYEVIASLDRLTLEYDYDDIDTEYILTAINEIKANVNNVANGIVAISESNELTACVYKYYTETIKILEGAPEANASRVTLSSFLKEARIEITIYYASLLAEIGE